ncbi:S23 ribosomal protein [Caldicellulosiruptor owensensis OL]|uniref:S23 ribosomal protein n=1 Tax=Caldicellulosiruptor owensensis (strain ATCC 700167 / DSM 13100 / OL) TaxID=632518 RepID=E4Q676_CALOW|nr:four helix bundle protein [Caldicellulosiruptor owensensis]ADQ05561.1 S23 ribosomal protein [Caldicellulosiruptor owensensis OL]
MAQNDYSIKDFKTLIVWQKARELTQDIYKVSANFPQFETYAAKSQIIRAIASIGANIAEGNGQLYKKKQINFFNNALGSASETRHWLVIAADNGYISEEDYTVLEQKTIEIIKMLIGCIRKLQEQAEDEEIA